MTWVKLDDGILDHGKIAQVGALGFALHVAGIVHCGRNLTDGFVPYSAARRLLDLEFVAGEQAELWHVSLTHGMAGYDDRDAIERVLIWLCDAGLWERVAHGYLIHDYLDYNPSRAKVLEERAKKQAAGKAGGQASAKARASGHGSKQAETQAPALALSKPVPVPEPVPQNAESEEPPTASGKAGGKVGSHIPDRWPHFLGKLAEDKAWAGITIGACVKLAQETSLDAVTTALSFAATDPPTLNGSAYGWLKATAHGLQDAVSA